MKARRLNKVLGITIGERSLLLAEVAAADKPEIRRLAEFVYPDGVSLADPAKLGAALGEHLQTLRIATRSAVIGLPAKWLVVKPKEVPPTDAATLADLLRLQAEGDFSTELKDLVYDYLGQGESTQSRQVLLVATPQKYLDAARVTCEAAKLSLVGVTSSAIALSQVTGAGPAMVLAIGPSGAELSGAHGQAIRHLRSGGTDRAFVGELRRAVSAIPANGGGRELILWDATGLSAESLSSDLGFPVRSAGFASLGVAAGGNGGDPAYAPPVAVAVAAMDRQPLPVDFLHSKLAVSRRRRLPRWAWLAVAAAVVLIAAGALLYRDLLTQEANVARMNADLANMSQSLTSAQNFVNRVSFAQGWHHGDTRYLACLRDLTDGMPDDNATYATKLTIREATRSDGGKTIPTGDLAGQLYGKTSDQQRVQMAIDSLKQNPNFVEVKFGHTQDAGRSREVSFSITFVYRPPAPTIAPSAKK